MTARDKARAAKLRRIPDSAFALEADRRGYLKPHAKEMRYPVQEAREHATDLRAVLFQLLRDPMQAIHSSSMARILFRAAESLETYRGMHERFVEGAAPREGGAP